MTVFTPDTLAKRWSCSAQHVRELIRRRQLRAFKLGGTLLRIPLEFVEEFECAHMTIHPTLSASTGENSPSYSTKEVRDTVARLDAVTRVKLAASRHRSGSN